jgi:serine protease DegS
MRFQSVATLISTSLAAAFAVTLAILVLRPDLFGEAAPPAAEQEPAPEAVLGSGPVSYADGVDRVAPSVVNIYSTKVKREPGGMQQAPMPRYFFGQFPPQQELETSLGSGVIVGSEGYLLTNHHNIAETEGIKVVLADGRDVAVSLVGSDADTDIAVLKIEDTSHLPSAPLGDSGKIRVGDVVLAIGNPLGVGQTVTMGIVSATGRSRLGINAYENFIQTDAAINPGNSGGALINAEGELIGINTAIFSETGSSHGIGFAIPVELAIGVMRQLVANGRMTQAWIGIDGQDVTAELAESFGLRDTGGVLVSEVSEEGPAELAGLRPGDVITHIDQIEPRDVHHLSSLIATKLPGTRVQIGAWRGNERLELTAITSARPGH